jgi:glycyl-tRNA synthetase beta chain
LGDDVAAAISCQYDPARAAQLGDSSSGRVAKCLIVADQIDKLAGYLGLGLAPSGSSDPFGLRRAATILIETAWSWPAMKTSFDSLLGAALHGYAEQAITLDAHRARSLMAEIFANRYPVLMPEARYDILAAALAPDDIAGTTSPRTVAFRVRCLGDLVADEGFVQTATRPINIVAAARKKSIAIPETPNRADLDSPEGAELLGHIERAAPDVRKAVETEDERLLADALRSIGAPIVRFFDTTLVMAEEPRVRDARLALMQSAAACFLQAGDFSKIVQEG